MVVKPISWSFSSRQDFKTCARQYHELRVLKNYPKQDNIHNIWGDRVHKAFEGALRDGKAMPEEMALWQGVVEQFRKMKGTLLVEQQLTINKDFQPTEWFAPDAWCRGVIDAMWIDGDLVRAVDWKTGKRKPNSDQLALFALLIFHHYPEVERVKTMFVWLKTFEKDFELFTRDQMPTLWQRFLPDVQRIEKAFATDVWLPTSSGLCYEYCPVKTCEFQGKRRGWR